MSSPSNIQLPAAALVEPNSIEFRVACGDGAELLLRRRPPGSVALRGGQVDHMLMSSVGRAEAGSPALSVLRTHQGVKQWRRPPSGQVTSIPAGTPLDWEWSYHSESIHLILQPTLLERVQRECGAFSGGERPLNSLIRTAHEPLRYLLNQLRQEALTPAAGQSLALSSLTHLAVLHVLRAAGGEGSEGAAGISSHELKRALELIEDRLDENLTLAELAAECGLSTFHFARAFRQEVGHPPHEYLIRRRVQRARELLVASPKQSVTSIACQLGFADESHLRRHFKRIIGTTPGRFRS